jgi:plastocyanin
MFSPRTTRIVAVAVMALAIASCGDDYPDGYTASADEQPLTREPVATDAPADVTDAPAGDASDAEEPADADGTTEADGSAGEADADAEDVSETYPPNGTVEEVWAIDNTFRVPEIEVEAGTEVLWINRGRNEHDVEPVDETQDWGVGKDAFVPGDEYSYVFDTPGVYNYYCTLHATPDAGMIGRVVVVAPEG